MIIKAVVLLSVLSVACIVVGNKLAQKWAKQNGEQASA